MSDKNGKNVDTLADIIRALADVWPNDRENVMVAGANLKRSSVSSTIRACNCSDSSILRGKG